MDHSSFRRVIDTIKEYWFLITILGSAVLSIAYMAVFQVNPWDKQRAAKLKRERVRFHNAVGNALLEAGNFKQAKAEFDEALKLAAVEHAALNGRYLTQLFLGLDSPDWNPAVGLAIQSHLAQTRPIGSAQLLHVIDKYLGDLHARISNSDLAKSYYQKALGRKPDYTDALYTLGWLHYSEGPDIDAMESCFRKMTEVSRFDYRGFHGLGYALYMKTIREPDTKKRTALIADAAKQSGSAKNLFFNQLNIIMDFGEVARSVDPGLSLFFHERGKKVLEDPVLGQMGENPLGLYARMLTGEGGVYLDGKDQKLVWVEYQIALDYLALYRLGAEPDAEKQHQHRLTKALAMDLDQVTHAIYLDQSAILDRLLPARKS